MFVLRALLILSPVLKRSGVTWPPGTHNFPSRQMWLLVFGVVGTIVGVPCSQYITSDLLELGLIYWALFSEVLM